MAKAKGQMIWGGLIAIVLIGLAFFVFGEEAPEIDYSPYTYHDSEIDNPEATHTIVEYSDFQCPFCAQTAPILRAVKNDFDVNVEYKHFPLTSIHGHAQLAAEASECARDQGKFWAYHDALFANQAFLAKSHLISHARGIGLDVDQFKGCLDGREKQVVVAKHTLEGKQKNVQGTPTIYLDGELVTHRTYAAFAGALQG